MYYVPMQMFGNEDENNNKNLQITSHKKIYILHIYYVHNIHIAISL